MLENVNAVLDAGVFPDTGESDNLDQVLTV